MDSEVIMSDRYRGRVPDRKQIMYDVIRAMKEDRETVRRLSHMMRNRRKRRVRG